VPGSSYAMSSYQLLHVISIGLAALTVLDAIVLMLIWHEYRFAILARRPV